MERRSRVEITHQDRLPESEAEWLQTGKFHVETVDIDGRPIRCALTRASKKRSLVTMAGGIPRDPERRKNLPLINKLYGLLALKLLERDQSGLLYNQPSTGGSGGQWETETFRSRTAALADVTQHFSSAVDASDVALVGTSAGGYMAVRALEQLQARGIKIPKLVLLSPGAYPEGIENVPYGAQFTELIRKPWNVAESPVFPQLERYVHEGGSLQLAFFEADALTIPPHIEQYYRSFAQKLLREGGNVQLMTIPGVAHNFRKLGAHEGPPQTDNESVKSTALTITDFLTRS